MGHIDIYTLAGLLTDIFGEMKDINFFQVTKASYHVFNGVKFSQLSLPCLKESTISRQLKLFKLNKGLGCHILTFTMRLAMSK